MFLTRAKNIYYPVMYRKHFSSFAMEDLRKLLSLFSLWDLGRGDDSVWKIKGEVRAARSNERRSGDKDELDIREARKPLWEEWGKHGLCVWMQAERSGRAGESNQRHLRWRQALGGFGTRLERLGRL